MNYETAQNSISRTKIEKVTIEMNYCNNSFGVAPCNAVGVECYNTFFTCKSKTDYLNIIKKYEFVSGDVNSDLARKLFPARPYIKNVNDLPTEIKESDTVTKTLKVVFHDEPDSDLGNDPYYASRDSIQGTYWKKWIARNPNFKGKIIKQEEAFAVGFEVSEFKTKFIGRIENITFGKGTVTVEATSLLKKLSEYKYPLESKFSLYADLPNVFSVSSDNEMLQLNAVEGDFARRNDFGKLDYSGKQIFVTPGSLVTGVYHSMVVGYDSYDRAFTKKIVEGIVIQNVQGEAIGSFELIWKKSTNESYYKIYKKLAGADRWIFHVETASLYTTVGDLLGLEEEPMQYPERYFQLSGSDPEILGNWNSFQQDMTIDVTLNSDFDNSGYLKIDKEIVYYSDKSTGVLKDTLSGVKRHRYDSTPERHKQHTKLHYMFMEDKNNPFTLLKKILQRAGIEKYADPKFAEYEQSWSGINFSCSVIVKDTKLNKIYFDLINALDCISWDGEDGLIKLLKRSEQPSSFKTITDKANIIENTGKIDLNEKSRKTEWFLYWHKWDIEAAIDEKEAYRYGVAIIDVDAEHENEYDEIVEDAQFTIWINEDSGTRDEIENYLSGVLNNRKTRTRDAQKIYECNLEMKDGNISTGELVLLSTNDLQNVDGSAYSNVKFRVIKKIPVNEKIKIKMIEEV